MQSVFDSRANELFFETLYGDNGIKKPVPSFEFLFPTTVRRVDSDNCGVCNHGEKREILPDHKYQILRIPIPDDPAPNESFQQLVDEATAAFRHRGICGCNPKTCGCQAEVGKTSQRLLFNASALIIQLQRLDYDLPEGWKEGDKPKVLKYKNVRRRVSIPDVLKVPSLDALQLSNMNFELCSAVEHIGSIDR